MNHTSQKVGGFEVPDLEMYALADALTWLVAAHANGPGALLQKGRQLSTDEVIMCEEVTNVAWAQQNGTPRPLPKPFARVFAQTEKR